MTLTSPTSFTGSLYMRKQESAEIVQELCSRVAGLQVAGDAIKGWTHMTLTSRTPLLRTAELLSEYHYDFLVRPGKASRFLLVSTHTKFAEALLERASMETQVSRPDVGVSALVYDLVQQPGKYGMSAIYARTDGQREALRSVGFFGADVGESLLFKELLYSNEIVPYRVSLRDVVTLAETLSIGWKGDIAFNYSGENSLHDVDLSLKFVSERGYLQWEAQ